MNSGQLFTILTARWKVVLSTLAVFILVGVTLAFALPKKYRATASVVIDARNLDPVQWMGLAGPLPGYMATQIDIINSEAVARRVVDILKLEQTELYGQWREQTDGEGDFRSWAGQLLQRYLEVLPAKESSVISISYTAPSAQFASAVANDFVKAYTETSISLRTTPAKTTSEFFDQQANRAKQQLISAQEKLSQFQREKGIVGNVEQLDAETAKLNELAASLVQLRSQSADANSRSNRVGARGGDGLAEVMNNPVVAGLRADIARTEARLQELTAKFGDSHPDVVQLRANLAELNRKVSQETNRALSSVVTSSTVANAREAEMIAANEAQRKKVLRLKEDRDTASILQREVDTALRAYEIIMEKISKSDMESKATLTNVSALTPATPPSSPYSPKKELIIMISVVLGGIFGTILAVLREQSDARIRSVQDVIDTLDLPLLGEMPSGKNPRPGIFLKPARKPSSLIQSIKKPQALPAPSSSS